MGVDGPRPGRPPMDATASRSGRSPARGRGGAARGVAAACAGDDFLRDHPRRSRSPAGEFGSARVASDHPLPVSLARDRRGRHRAPPAHARRALRRRHAAVRQRRRDADASSSGRATSASRTAPTSASRSREVEDCARVLAAWVVARSPAELRRQARTGLRFRDRGVVETELEHLDDGPGGTPVGARRWCARANWPNRATLGRHLHVSAEGVGQPHLVGARHERAGGRARRRRSLMQRAREVATLRRCRLYRKSMPRGASSGRGRRHRVDADRGLLALELVDGSDAGLRGQPALDLRRPGRCTARRCRSRPSATGLLVAVLVDPAAHPPRRSTWPAPRPRPPRRATRCRRRPSGRRASRGPGPVGDGARRPTTRWTTRCGLGLEAVVVEDLRGEVAQVRVEPPRRLEEEAAGRRASSRRGRGRARAPSDRRRADGCPAAAGRAAVGRRAGRGCPSRGRWRPRWPARSGPPRRRTGRRPPRPSSTTPTATRSRRPGSLDRRRAGPGRRRRPWRGDPRVVEDLLASALAMLDRDDRDVAGRRRRRGRPSGDCR